MAELFKTMKDSFIFLIFLCVRIEINSHWLNISLSVGQFIRASHS